ncbi:hypothetical protein [Oscillibacter sp.]|jgi:hypothetical protein|uniref:hypothetical protein n=1 Tax=Oscillibacter sp. TaxID=1945593 RepID=UPI00217212F3|nr:hypothetical protein [Oscillibacter sp.]MCI9650018.1 hypothetical protein [Oscillibacter sp.]
MNHQKLSKKCLLAFLDTLVQSVKLFSLLPSSRLCLTHNLTQNRKKTVESMEQRGLESISRRAEKLPKVPKTSKPYFEAQLITRRSQVQVLSPQPARKFSPPFRFRLCRKLHCGGNFFAFALDSLRWTRGRVGRERRRQLVRKIDFNRLLHKSADFVGNRRFFRCEKLRSAFCDAYPVLIIAFLQSL